MNGNAGRPGRDNQPGDDRRPGPRPPQWNPRPNPPRPEPPRPPRPPRPEPPRPPRPEPPRPPRPPRPEPPRPPRPQPVENIIVVRNAVITDVDILPTGSFVTISYEIIDPFNRAFIETVRLVITRDTQILNQFRQPISVWGLRVGMRVNVRFSSAMTRSIPPQAVAFRIRIVNFS